MQKKCESCGKILNIPDEKIPEGKTVVVTCPSCREKIRIKKEENPFDFDEDSFDIPDFGEDSDNTESMEKTEKQNPFEESDEKFDFSEGEAGDPFDFIEEEGLMAMICVEDANIRKDAAKVLEYMDYSVFSPEDNNQALRELRMRGDFSMIVVDEDFCCEDISNNAVLRYVKRLPMRDRREVFVLLLSGKRRTFERKDAFVHSVNMVINTAHMSKFEDLVKKGFTENENFYRNFKETLKKGLKF
ncbi:MAG: zinc-ribbon domain-containing protein [Desulfobacteraceae bacterium]|nr:zinc-ribbon domain-containing protein [Desulfobacteraceae bacterium]